MTKVKFFKSNDQFIGLECSGHTGYADEGEDVLCAAISAMTMLIINAIEVAYVSVADYSIDEVTTNIRLYAPDAMPKSQADPKKKYAISGLIKAYYCQLKELEEEYYGFLEVTEVERQVK